MILNVARFEPCHIIKIKMNTTDKLIMEGVTEDEVREVAD